MELQTIELTLIVFGSLRRSFLLPTKMIGTFGQKCLTCKMDEMNVIGVFMHIYSQSFIVAIVKNYQAYIYREILTSGVHFSGIFSNESGESTEKHIRMTFVSG